MLLVFEHHSGQFGLYYDLQPRVVELESGEKNPQIETLVKIAATTGIEFAFDVVPVGQEPTLIRKSFKGAPAHVYAGGSMLVAAR